MVDMLVHILVAYSHKHFERKLVHFPDLLVISITFLLNFLFFFKYFYLKSQKELSNFKMPGIAVQFLRLERFMFF